MDSHSHCYHILPYITAAAIAYSIYTTYRLCTKSGSCKKAGRCNTDHRLNEDKIVHSFDIESLGEKSVFCRCWKSKKFPYCDGAHNEHNKSTDDNVGPLIIKKEP